MSEPRALRIHHKRRTSKLATGKFVAPGELRLPLEILQEARELVVKFVAVHRHV